MTTRTSWKSFVAILALAVAAGCGDDDDDPPIETQGTIHGMVTDADGAPLAGATITTTPATITVHSGADGHYMIELDAGTYRVTAALDGFVTTDRDDVTVTAGASVTLDLLLPAALGTFVLQVDDGCGAGGLAGATVQVGGTVVGTTDASGALELPDLEPGEYALEVTASGYLPDGASGTVVAGETATAQVTLICQTRAVGDLARAFTAKLSASFSGVTSAQALHDLIYDADPANDPIIVSVRKPEDYALGHVPGAINIPWKTIADDPVGRFGEPDGTQTIVDYCYTGHTGAIAAGVLNLLGYTAMNLKYGIVSWTTDPVARTAAGVEPDLTHDFTVETTANVPAATYELPWLAFDGVTTAFEAAQKAAQAYLVDAVPTIAAQALFDLLNDGDPSNDPVIVSVRKPEHYAIGHIPGAINLPYATIADEASLRKLPPDRPIVVYCYTGHTGGIATAILGTLGYDVKNLKYGMAGWTQDAAVRATTVFNPATDAHDFPLEP